MSFKIQEVPTFDYVTTAPRVTKAMTEPQPAAFLA